jgi:hypothetical protein
VISAWLVEHTLQIALRAVLVAVLAERKARDVPSPH